MSTPIVIIGTGLAGYNLAKEFRKLNSTTKLTLITQDDGNFYSKPQLSTALANQKEASDLVITPAAVMAEQLNAHIKTHTLVKAIHPTQHLLELENGEMLPFTQLILACGATPIPLTLLGNAASEVMSVNNLTDYSNFRYWLKNKKHLLILGAGLVACEFANDLVTAGYQVDIVAPELYPLAHLVPKPISIALKEILTSKGVNWHLERLATSVNKTNHLYDITLSDNTHLSAEGVLAAIGLKPNLTLAHNAGITVNRGIVVDQYLQTNFPSIFALGDCAEIDNSVRFYVKPLLQSACALAQTLTGKKMPVSFPIMPIGIKTSLYPIVTLPPSKDAEGKWHFEGEDQHICGLFHDYEDKLQAFCLAGDKTREKASVLERMEKIQ